VSDVTVATSSLTTLHSIVLQVLMSGGGDILKHFIGLMSFIKDRGKVGGQLVMIAVNK